jgi:hypothetical protein
MQGWIGRCELRPISHWQLYAAQATGRIAHQLLHAIDLYDEWERAWPSTMHLQAEGDLEASWQDLAAFCKVSEPERPVKRFRLTLACDVKPAEYGP